MDPLTHTATGLFLSRAGLSRFTPGAAAILMLAANAPDADVVTAAGGALHYLNYHRHLTHSLLLMPAMALLPPLLVRLVGRRPIRWLGAYFISLLGVASHLALDYTNVYGIRLLLPWSGQWLRADLTSVVDPLIWAVLGLAVAAPFLSRLVQSEIASATRQARAQGRGWALAALLFLAGYNGGRALLHARAVAVLDARLYAGAAPVRVAAVPVPMNPWRWRGLVETTEFYSLHDLNLAADFDPSLGQVFFKPGVSPEQEAAARAPAVRDFLHFAQYPFWRIQPSRRDDTTEVQVLDLRFGTPFRPGFAATAVLDSRLRVVQNWFTFNMARPR